MTINTCLKLGVPPGRGASVREPTQKAEARPTHAPLVLILPELSNKGLLLTSKEVLFLELSISLHGY